MIRLLFSRIGIYIAGLLAFIGLGAGIYAKGRKDYRAKDRLQMSEDRVHTLKEMRDETAKAMAQDDADLVRSLTDKRR